MKTTEEKNRMIAKFMGFKDLGNLVGGSPRVEKHVRGITYQSYPYSELNYHASWDWLMPVVEKIETELNYEVLIGRIYSQVNIIGDEDNTISKWVCGDPKKKLEITYETICKFIEWYNENK